MYFNNNTFKKNKIKADKTKPEISSLRKNFHLELTHCVFCHNSIHAPYKTGLYIK